MASVAQPLSSLFAVSDTQAETNIDATSKGSEPAEVDSMLAGKEETASAKTNDKGTGGVFAAYAARMGGKGIKKYREAPNPKKSTEQGHEDNPTSTDEEKEKHDEWGLEKAGDEEWVATGEEFKADANDNSGEASDMEVEAADEEAAEKAAAEREAADKEAAAALQAQGRMARHNETFKQRPQDIEKLWRSLYPIVKGWWAKGGKDLTKHEENSILKIQESIQRRCAILARKELDQNPDFFASEVDKNLSICQQENSALPKEEQMSQEMLKDIAEKNVLKFYQNKVLQDFKFGFPAETMFVSIRAILATLHEIIALQDPETSEKEAADLKRQEQEVLLFKGVAIFLEGLEMYKIPVQSVVSEEMRSIWDDISKQSSQESQNIYEQCLQELRKPTEDQRTIWAENLLEIEKVLNLIDASEKPSGTDAMAVKRILEHLKVQNERIRQSNKEQDIPSETNLLPHKLLTNLHTAWSNQNNDKLANSKRELLGYFAEEPLATDFYSRFKGTVKPSKSKTATALSSMAPTTTPKRPSDTSPGKIATATASSNTAPATTSPKGKVTGPVHSSASVSPDLAALRNALDDDVIEMFNYADGMTEFGPVVGIRPTTGENQKYNRFFINMGTEDFPHYKVVRGSEFCPGGAEALSKLKNMDTIFDLRAKKQQLRTIPNFIKCIGPGVEVQRSATYNPRPGARPRRPDFYLRVTYIDEKQDWLCRSEYISFVGKACAERQIEKLILKYNKRSVYLNECIRQGVHPVTLEALQEHDRIKTPWLFETTLSSKASTSNPSSKHQDMFDIEFDPETEVPAGGMRGQHKQGFSAEHEESDEEL